MCKYISVFSYIYIYIYLYAVHPRTKPTERNLESYPGGMSQRGPLFYSRGCRN